MTTDAHVDAYPTADQDFYGRHTWALGEDAEDGVMVQGHGRRALAALNAHQRDENGRGWWRSCSPAWPWSSPPRITELWVTFHETCGCTPEEHAQHLADDNVYPCDDCEHAGLPPCDPDRLAWTYERVEQDTPGALPVTEALW